MARVEDGADAVSADGVRTRLHAANPFPGLRPFDYHDRHLFAGRDSQIEDVRVRLTRNNFLAVIGVSGSGKSSLIKAGLVPVLYQGFLESAGTRWNIALMRPGKDPLRRLAEALRESELIKKDGDAKEAFFEHKRGLLSIADGFGDDENLLLVVDQFEEIFRYKDLSDSSDADNPLMAIGEADAFIRVLLDGLSDDRIFIVTTMRSDFLGDCARFPRLAQQINRGQYLIPALLPNEQREIVEFPVHARKASITEPLISRLLADLGSEPSQLPVVQHALRQIWEAWAERAVPDSPLDIIDYDKVGGCANAMSRHASFAYRTLPSEEHRRITKVLFQRITLGRDDGKPPTRRPAELRDILEVLNKNSNVDCRDKLCQVIKHYRDDSVAFISKPPTSAAFHNRDQAKDPNPDDLKDGSIVDITHESLCQLWPDLRQWVKEEVDAAMWYQRITQSARLIASVKGQKRDPLPDGELSTIVRNYLPDSESKWFLWTRPWSKRYNFYFAEVLKFIKYSQRERNHVPDSESKRLRWTRPWSKRYNSYFEEVLKFIKYSQREQLKRKLLQLSLTVLLIGLVYLGWQWMRSRELARENTEFIADRLADEAIAWFRVGGSYTQERSALYDSASRATLVNSKNSDLGMWDSYLRIRRPLLRRQVFADKGTDLVAYVDSKQGEVLAVKGSVPQRAAIAFLDGETGDPLTTGRAPYINSDYPILTQNGRYTAKPCGPKLTFACVVDTQSGQELFRSSQEGEPRLVNSSSGGSAVVLGYRVNDKLVIQSARLDRQNEIDKCSLFHVPQHNTIASADAISIDVTNDSSFVAVRYIPPATKAPAEPHLILLTSRDLSSQCHLTSHTAPLGARNEKRHGRTPKDNSDLMSFPGIGDVVDAQFSADDKYLAVGLNQASKVRIFDGSANWREKPGPVHFTPITAIAFSRKNSDYIASASQDGDFRMSQIGAVDEPLWFAAVPQAVQAIAFSPKDAGDDLVVAGNADNTTRVYEVKTGIEVSRLTSDQKVNAVAFNAKGDRVVAGSQDGWIQVFNPLPPVGAPIRIHPQEVACDDNVSVPLAATLFTSDDYIALECVRQDIGSGDRTTAAKGKPIVRKLGVTSRGRTIDVAGLKVGCMMAGGSDTAISGCPKISPEGNSETEVTLVGKGAEDRAGQLTLDGIATSVAVGKEEFVTSSHVQVNAFNQATGLLQVFNRKGELRCQGLLPTQAQAMAFGGQYLAVAFTDVTVSHIWIYSGSLCDEQKQVLNPTIRLKLSKPAPINVLAFNKVTSKLGVGSTEWSAVLSIPDGTLIAWSSHQRPVRAVAFDDDDTKFASGDDSGVTNVIQLTKKGASGSDKNQDPFVKITPPDPGTSGALALGFQGTDHLIVVYPGQRRRFPRQGESLASTSVFLWNYDLDLGKQIASFCGQMTRVLPEDELEEVAKSKDVKRLCDQHLEGSPHPKGDDRSNPLPSGAAIPEIAKE